MIHNPVDARVGRCTDANALTNSDDDNLWCTFDITAGLDDGCSGRILNKLVW
jgi:hypothetical protein